MVGAETSSGKTVIPGGGDNGGRVGRTSEITDPVSPSPSEWLARHASNPSSDPGTSKSTVGNEDPEAVGREMYLYNSRSVALC